MTAGSGILVAFLQIRDIDFRLLVYITVWLGGVCPFLNKRITYLLTYFIADRGVCQPRGTEIRLAMVGPTSE